MLCCALNHTEIPLTKVVEEKLTVNSSLILDGLPLLPWRNGKSVFLNVTVLNTLKRSYVEHSFKNAGTAAELASI